MSKNHQRQVDDVYSAHVAEHPGYANDGRESVSKERRFLDIFCSTLIFYGFFRSVVHVVIPRDDSFL